MALIDLFSTARAIETLLKKEKLAILSADFDTLDSLYPRKVSLLAKLEETQVAPASLERIKAQLARNNRMLLSTAKGIKTAQVALKNLRSRDNVFHAYGPEGQTKDISRKSLTIKKKI